MLLVWCALSERSSSAATAASAAAALLALARSAASAVAALLRLPAAAAALPSLPTLLRLGSCLTPLPLSACAVDARSQAGAIGVGGIGRHISLAERTRPLLLLLCHWSIPRSRARVKRKLAVCVFGTARACIDWRVSRSVLRQPSLVHSKPAASKAERKGTREALRNSRWTRVALESLTLVFSRAQSFSGACAFAFSRCPRACGRIREKQWKTCAVRPSAEAVERLRDPTEQF